MSTVLSIRIPRELKKKMDELRNEVDWKREIIEFLEYRVKMYMRSRAIDEVHGMLENLPSTPRGTGASSVREDRDSS